MPQVACRELAVEASAAELASPLVHLARCHPLSVLSIAVCHATASPASPPPLAGASPSGIWRRGHDPRLLALGAGRAV